MDPSHTQGSQVLYPLECTQDYSTMNLGLQILNEM